MAVSAELGTHLEQFVAKLVSSGRYNSKSEVLRDGLRLLEEREAKLAVLDAMVAEGLADIDVEAAFTTRKTCSTNWRPKSGHWPCPAREGRHLGSGQSGYPPDRPMDCAF